MSSAFRPIRILTTALILLLLVPGCDCAPDFSLPIFPESEHQDSVRIAAFDYEPSGQIRVGETLTFYVTMEKHFSQHISQAFVCIGSETRPLLPGTDHYKTIRPHNTGKYGDASADDKIWTLRYTWPEYYEPQADIPIYTVNTLGRVDAQPLTVLPALEVD